MENGPVVVERASAGLIYRLHDLTIDVARREVVRDGKKIALPGLSFDLLVALVRAAPNLLTYDELMERVWPGVVVSPETITQRVKLVRDALGDDPKAPRYIVGIRGRGYRVDERAAPCADVERASSPERVGSRDRRFGRQHVVAGTIGITLLALLVLALLADRRESQGRSHGLGRFQIEPFEPIAEFADADRFAKILTESLERDLATNGIETVPFVPATHGSESSNPHVDYSLRGTVDRDADRLTVTADIVDRSNTRILWSITLQRNELEPRQLQELFSTHVASVVKCGWRARRNAHGDASPDLVAKFMRFCDNQIANRHSEQMEVARSIRDMAPRYAISHAMFAGANAMKTIAEYERITPTELARSRALTYESANTALAIDRDLGSPYWAMALVHDPENSLAERERLLLKGLEVDPELVYVRNAYAAVLSAVGRRHEAADYYVRYANDEPLFPAGPLHKARAAVEEHDMATARQMFARADALMVARFAKTEWAMAEHWLGDASVASSLLGEELRARWKERGVWPCWEAFVAARASGTPFTEAEITQACASGYHVPAEELFAYFGHVDAAFRVIASWPEDYFSRGPFLPPMSSLFTPRMQSVRADPRFMPLAARLGLVDYWIETDQWPDFCSTEKLRYDCREAAAATRMGAPNRPTSTR